MAIEMQSPLKPQHRCTACGANWWPEGKPGWEKCAHPDRHPCPKCSAPKAKAEPVVECGSVWHRMSRDDLQNSSINYCPQCGKRLREE